MSAYIPVAIWFVSAFICLYIARRRHLRLSFLRKLMVVLLGPIAIPVVMLIKTDTHQS